ncbi:MAG: hypothetical protein U0231_10530 [Nitrospiraceae bacterium]
MMASWSSLTAFRPPAWPSARSQAPRLGQRSGENKKRRSVFVDGPIGLPELKSALASFSLGSRASGSSCSSFREWATTSSGGSATGDIGAAETPPLLPALRRKAARVAWLRLPVVAEDWLGELAPTVAVAPAKAQMV